MNGLRSGALLFRKPAWSCSGLARPVKESRDSMQTAGERSKIRGRPCSAMFPVYEISCANFFAGAQFILSWSQWPPWMPMIGRPCRRPSGWIRSPVSLRLHLVSTTEVVLDRLGGECSACSSAAKLGGRDPRRGPIGGRSGSVANGPTRLAQGRALPISPY